MPIYASSWTPPELRLFLALDGSAFPLETRERACLLLCYLANSSEKAASDGRGGGGVADLPRNVNSDIHGSACGPIAGTK